MKARYRCLKCNYKYEGEPGPTQCPECKHLYIKWVNYEEWRENENSRNEIRTSQKGMASE